MSRSYKHTPIIGNVGARSESDDKRMANRRLRRITRALLHRGEYHSLPTLREVSDVYAFAKDGKQYLRTDEVIRK